LEIMVVGVARGLPVHHDAPEWGLTRTAATPETPYLTSHFDTAPRKRPPSGGRFRFRPNDDCLGTLGLAESVGKIARAFSGEYTGGTPMLPTD